MTFKIKGFSVNLKPSFFVLCAGLVLLGKQAELCVIVLSVTLHEMAHIAAAYACGIRAEGITVTPIGQTAHINCMEQISFIRRLAVVFAGPAVNLALWLLFDSNINMSLFLLNILPVYPLDGGRALHYILSLAIGVLRANRAQSFLSKALAYVLFALGFVQIVLYGYNFSLLCIGFYLIRINRREYINMTFAFYRSIMYRSDKKVLGVRGLAAGEGIKLKTVVYRLGWDYYTIVHIRDKSGKCKRTVNEEELISYILRHNINHRLRDLTNTNGVGCL